MTRHDRFTRRHLGKAALAGATLLGAPMALRHAAAQAPANLKVALLLPTSGLQAQIGQACRRGADIANDVFYNPNFSPEGAPFTLLHRPNAEALAGHIRAQLSRSRAVGDPA